MFTFRLFYDNISKNTVSGEKMTLLENNSGITESKKSNYNSIDLFKFLCAFLVFAIHIQPFPAEAIAYAGYLNILTQKYICRLAVPFYFTASGFFLFRKTNTDKIDFSVIKNYCFKILCLYGIWSIISYSMSTGHLWYLKALVVATLIVGLLIKYRVKFKYITIFAVVLYIIGLSGDSYYQIIKSIGENNFLGFLVEQYDALFENTRNGLFMGVIFVFIGAAFSQKKISIKTIYSVSGFLVSMVLLLAEVYLVEHYELSKDTNMYIFLVPATVFLFDLLLKIKLKDRKIYPQLRVIGMIIYYSHIMVREFVNHIFTNIEYYFRVDFSKFLFIITLFFVVILAVFVERISHKENFKWLQHIYK